MNRDEFERFCNVVNAEIRYAKGWKDIDYQMCLDLLRTQGASVNTTNKLKEKELKEEINKIDEFLDFLREQRASASVDTTNKLKEEKLKEEISKINEFFRVKTRDKQYKEDQDDYNLKTELVKIFSHPWVLCTLLYFFVVTLLLCFPDSLLVILPSLQNWGWLPNWGWLVIGWFVILSFLFSVYLVKMFFIETITVTRNLFWKETGQLLGEYYYVKGILMLVVTFFITLFIWFIKLWWPPFTSGEKETS